MRILLVNDDGVYSKGILALANALKDENEVTIIAPERQMSGTSHCITFYNYINYAQLEIIDDVKTYILKGTPADCVKFGIDKILGYIPDLVISGINKGYNIGTDIVYSGTVNAALEGSIMGVKSIAVSQEYYAENFDNSAIFIKDNLNLFLDMLPTDATTILNINIPSDKKEEIKGYKICTVGHVRYNDEYIFEENRGYYLTGSLKTDVFNEETSDVHNVNLGYITISFVKQEMNDFNLFEKFRDIKL